jgi:acetolactate synthase small subunit
MREYSLKLSDQAGCLDAFAKAATGAGLRLQNLSCACGERDVIATFSVQETEHDVAQLASAIQQVGAQQTNAPILNFQVANRAGCLEHVVAPFSQAGVRIQSLSCACSPAAEFGQVSVSFRRD